MAGCRIVVIGAGIIGVSTAYNLQSGVPNAQVTIIAEQFSPNTTSDVAAGHWRPHATSATSEVKIQEWGQVTWDHLMTILTSEESNEVGLSMTSGRELYHQVEPKPFWADTVLGFRTLTGSELALYPAKYKDGFFYTTLNLNSSRYIPWLTKKFISNGGLIKQAKITDFQELRDYDVIVNCAGMGSRDLCGDGELEPSRGHLIRAEAPWIKHFTLVPEELLHILPTFDGISLGFTNRIDSDLIVKQSDKERILNGCAQLDPSIRKATNLRDLLGFRPVRTRVRIEVERRRLSGKLIPIVHNYGHGGCGVTIHWGCAQEATKLVIGELRTKSNM